MWYTSKRGKKYMFREAKAKIDIWTMCLKMSFKSQAQYPASFVLKCLVMFITYFCEFIATYFLISKIARVDNWSKYEIMLIYGMATIAYSTSRLFLNSMNNLPRQLRTGQFLVKRIRPQSDLFCIMIEEIPIDRIGQVLLGVAITVLSFIHLKGSISVVWLIIYLITGTVIYSSIFVLCGSVSFWIVNARELLGVFTHGTLRAIVYPISIYSKLLRDVITYIVPVAFISYYPAIVILNKDANIHYIKWVNVLVCLVTWMIATLVWKIGMKRYEGSGG